MITVCVFAKPPRPGEVKTRLAAAVGKERAAALADAFLRDTWAAVTALPWARPVLATTELGTLAGAVEWLQGDGELPARLGRVLARACADGPALAIGADTPGLPRALLDAASAALETSEACLGPCDDGGFYAVGLRRCAADLFAGLPFGGADAFTATRRRLEERELSPRILAPWFDVDRPEDSERLHTAIRSGAVVAPATARALAHLA